MNLDTLLTRGGGMERENEGRVYVLSKEPSEKQKQYVAERVRQRREMLGLSQDLSNRGGPKRNAVGAFETRYLWPKLPATRARWAKALEWGPDAFDRLLAGEEPRESNILNTDPEELDRAFDALERAIAELRRHVARPSNRG